LSGNIRSVRIVVPVHPRRDVSMSLVNFETRVVSWKMMKKKKSARPKNWTANKQFDPKMIKQKIKQVRKESKNTQSLSINTPMTLKM
jgi:hypothetical protein